jgi:4-hydroxy-tetrahydrodipicolinate reductase
MKLKVGLIGVGKTGKAVANVILQNQEFSLGGSYDKAPYLKTEVCLNFLVLLLTNQEKYTH